MTNDANYRPADQATLVTQISALTQRCEILEARLAAVERLRWHWARDRRDNAVQFAAELHGALRLHGED